MFMAGHEVAQGYCLHCGAREDAITASLALEDGTQLSCRAGRKPDEPRPEPSLRTYAVDDIDVIHQRIAELAREREAAVAAPSEWLALFLDEDAAYLKW